MSNLLIVDDDRLFLLGLKHFFSNNGFYVATATDVGTAFGQIYCCNPSCILLDILMPGLNGIEFMNLLNYQFPGNSFKIILMSVLNQKELMDLGYRQGAVDYFSKPLILPMVLNRIREFQYS